MKKVAGIVALCIGLALAPMSASAHYKRHHHHSHDGRLIVGVGAGVATGVIVGGPVGAIVGGVVGLVIIHHPRHHRNW
jgi:hypothetical protein